MTQDSRSVVSQFNPININHWNNNPLNFITKVTFINLLQKTFHHPWSHTLSWVLSGYCYTNNFWLNFFIKHQVRYLIAQNWLSYDVSLGISQFMQRMIESLKSIRRLTSELDFVIVIFKIVKKAQSKKLTFWILKKLDGLGNVSKFGIFFFFGQIKRFESLIE
jgi:hypothetical protein